MHRKQQGAPTRRPFEASQGQARGLAWRGAVEEEAHHTPDHQDTHQMPQQIQPMKPCGREWACPGWMGTGPP